MSTNLNSSQHTCLKRKTRRNRNTLLYPLFRVNKLWHQTTYTAKIGKFIAKHIQSIHNTKYKAHNMDIKKFIGGYNEMSDLSKSLKYN